MMTLTLLFLGLFLLGVGLNAFFSGYQAGFVSCNHVRLRYKAEVENRLNAKRLLLYVEDPDRLITTILIGTNMALVLGALAITHLLGNFWASLIAIPVYLIFGEILPQSLFRLHPTQISLQLYPLIQFFDGILAPLVLPFVFLSRTLLKLLGSEKRDIRRFLTSLDDMRTLVDESVHHGTIAEEEKDMIHSVMDLQLQTAREIMVPRTKIQALSKLATNSELVRLLQESGRTRIPIYDDTIDHIIGVINAFDVLRDKHPEIEGIQRFITPVMHVPDSIHLDELIKKLRSQKQTMAILTDEFGGTDGLICIEDILEEIFGEIHDEFDEEIPQIRKVGKDAWVMDARMTLENVEHNTKLGIKDVEVDTLAGWVMHATNRIPKPGEIIEIEDYRITILGGDLTHISRIRLELMAKP